MKPEEAIQLSHSDAEITLRKCIESSKNILIVGAHGTGKTSLIKKVALEAGLKMGSSCVYLSGSTLDPWVDFVGVPRPDASGQYLQFFRPAYMDPENLELLVIDEINRSASKVRNACMELAQFRSVNGVKFPKLRAVWACANPADTDAGYSDAEAIDVALADRFPIIIKLSAEPDRQHFCSILGEEKGCAAVDWWHAISPESRRKVSPRRLEYAVEAIGIGIASSLVLPGVREAEYLESFLKGNDPIKILKNHIKKGEKKELADFMMTPVASNAIERIANNDEECIADLIELLPTEHAVAACVRDVPLRTAVGKLYTSWWNQSDRSLSAARSCVSVIHSIASITNNNINDWARKLISLNEPGAAIALNISMTGDKFAAAFSKRYQSYSIKSFSHSFRFTPTLLYETPPEGVGSMFKSFESQAKKNDEQASEIPSEFLAMLEKNPQTVINHAKILRKALTKWVIPILESQGKMGGITLSEPRCYRWKPQYSSEGPANNYDF